MSSENLNLFNNTIEGPLPTGIGTLLELTVLELGSNFLTGTIPTEIGNLFNLDVLSVYMNFLGGTIPTELGQLGFLRTLVIENNELTGPIPTEIGVLFSLGRCHSRNNRSQYLPRCNNIAKLIDFVSLVQRCGQRLDRNPSYTNFLSRCNDFNISFTKSAVWSHTDGDRTTGVPTSFPH